MEIDVEAVIPAGEESEHAVTGPEWMDDRQKPGRRSGEKKSGKKNKRKK
jgi:hypothetical protein